MPFSVKQTLINEEQLSLLRSLIQSEVKFALMNQQMKSNNPFILDANPQEILEDERQICEIVFKNLVELTK
tara:strand:+ start:3475 stop:3687 length:213 start_codon:yes stop_codon:yes gene_type:complete